MINTALNSKPKKNTPQIKKWRPIFFIGMLFSILSILQWCALWRWWQAEVCICQTSKKLDKLLGHKAYEDRLKASWALSDWIRSVTVAWLRNQWLSNEYDTFMNTEASDNHRVNAQDAIINKLHELWGDQLTDLNLFYQLLWSSEGWDPCWINLKSLAENEREARDAKYKEGSQITNEIKNPSSIESSLCAFTSSILKPSCPVDGEALKILKYILGIDFLFDVEDRSVELFFDTYVKNYNDHMRRTIGTAKSPDQHELESYRRNLCIRDLGWLFGIETEFDEQIYGINEPNYHEQASELFARLSKAAQQDIIDFIDWRKSFISFETQDEISNIILNFFREPIGNIDPYNEIETSYTKTWIVENWMLDAGLKMQDDLNPNNTVSIQRWNFPDNVIQKIESNNICPLTLNMTIIPGSINTAGTSWNNLYETFFVTEISTDRKINYETINQDIRDAIVAFINTNNINEKYITVIVTITNQKGEIISSTTFDVKL